MEMHSGHCYMQGLNRPSQQEANVAAAGIRLSAIDLNLLVVFDALMQEGTSPKPPPGWP